MKEEAVKVLAIAILTTCSKASTMQGMVNDAYKFYELIKCRMDKDKKED
jgi:hypothetical protein